MARKRKNNRETKEQIHEKIRDLFSKLGLSAIVYFPGEGTVSWFYDDEGRFRVIEHSKIEMMSDDIQHQRLAQLWADKELSKSKVLTKQETPSYVA